MKIEFHTKGVIITAKQKAVIEKKLLKTKKYFNNIAEPVLIDVILQDESSPEKGGIDQEVQIVATFGKEKILIKEVDDRLMRAFASAQKRFERKLEELHEEIVDKHKKPGGLRLEKVLGIIKRKKK